MTSSYVAPHLTEAPPAANVVDAEVAVAALVAAFLGIAVAVVIYICSVCNARSFWSCVSAVENYWTVGC